MSEIEEPSSTFELESIAQEELKKRAREKAARAQAASLQKLQVAPAIVPLADTAVEKPTPKPELPASPIKKQTSKKQKSRTVSGDKNTRDIIKKHNIERKALQKNISDLSKKRERDIRDLMEKVLKDHYAQVDKERADYVGVLSGLKSSLEGQTREITTSCQQVVTTAAQDEVEFMQELAKKSEQYEELRKSSEKQVNKMSEESDSKSQKIMMLDEKIKELALHLPKDIREELFEELGLEHLKAQEKPAKPEKVKGKGMFSKLSQLFKRSPSKPKSKPVQSKVKQVKTQQKRPSAENVIAQ
jgi:hypothetical protein